MLHFANGDEAGGRHRAGADHRIQHQLKLPGMLINFRLPRSIRQRSDHLGGIAVKGGEQPAERLDGKVAGEPNISDFSPSRPS